MTTTDPTIELGPATGFHIARDRRVAVHQFGADRHALVPDGHLLSVFDYDATWDRWERHPSGDEVVLLLAGDVDLALDDGGRDRIVPLRPGCAAVVPAGTWHRAVVAAPSRMLFLTPTATPTEQRPAP